MPGRRRKMGRHESRRKFRRGASHVHKKNMPKRMPMRGGIRL